MTNSQSQIYPSLADLPPQPPLEWLWPGWLARGRSDGAGRGDWRGQVLCGARPRPRGSSRICPSRMVPGCRAKCQANYRPRCQRLSPRSKACLAEPPGPREKQWCMSTAWVPGLSWPAASSKTPLSTSRLYVMGPDVDRPIKSRTVSSSQPTLRAIAMACSPRSLASTIWQRRSIKPSGDRKPAFNCSRSFSVMERTNIGFVFGMSIVYQTSCNLVWLH